MGEFADSLQSLELGRNHIAALDFNDFQNFSTLYYLSLRYNHLTNDDTVALEADKSLILRSLYLSHNQLNIIDFNLLAGLFMNVLIIGHNPSHDFINPTDLSALRINYLGLSGTPFEELPDITLSYGLHSVNFYNKVFGSLLAR